MTLSANNGFLHVLCLDGEGEIGGVACKKGESILLPAGLTNVTVCGKGFEIITSSAK